MGERLPACTCSECLEEGLRFPSDPIQLQLIPAGGPDIAGAAPCHLLDAPAVTAAGVSVPLPPGRVRTLAAATTGDVR